MLAGHAAERGWSQGCTADRRIDEQIAAGVSYLQHVTGVVPHYESPARQWPASRSSARWQRLHRPAQIYVTRLFRKNADKKQK